MKDEANNDGHDEKQVPPEVFISYSRLDADRCQPVVEALQSAGFTIWIDIKSITPGKNWITEIFRLLDRSDFVVVLLTKHAVNSPWVKKEYQTALISGIGGNGGEIIPVLLDSVELPAELRTIQAIDLMGDLEQGLAQLIRHISQGRTFVNGPSQTQEEPQPLPLSTETSPLSSLFGRLRKALTGVMTRSRRSHGNVELSNSLLDLHQDLLRLESVVSLISQTPPNDCAQMWEQTAQLMPGPIPGATSVLLQIDRTIAAKTAPDANGSRASAFALPKERLLLLRRYIEVLRDLSESLRGPVRGFLHLRAPEAAEQLSEIWKTKVSLRYSLRMRDQNLVSALLLADEDIMAYVEAGRLLESRMLTQLIDEDARGVAMDPESGLVALEELSRKHKEVSKSIVATRRELGRLINTYWPDAHEMYGGRDV